MRAVQSPIDHEFMQFVVRYLVRNSRCLMPYDRAAGHERNFSFSSGYGREKTYVRFLTGVRGRKTQNRPFIGGREYTTNRPFGRTTVACRRLEFRSMRMNE